MNNEEIVKNDDAIEDEIVSDEVELEGLEQTEEAIAPSKGEKAPKSVLAQVIDMVVYIAVVAGIAILVNLFVMQKVTVDGYSMTNTLYDHDQLMLQKVSYYFSNPERFDVVVFLPFGKRTETKYVKRVIGLPGEKIQIIDSTIYIDDKPLEEHYGKEDMESAGLAAEPITLGKDEYFVLGDNRNGSSDSRDEAVGIVHRDQIIGKILLRIWPLNRVGFID